MAMNDRTEAVRDYALSLGFDAVGVAPARVLEQDAVALARWLEAGRHGTMDYMAREPVRRTDPGKLLPGSKSVVVLAMNYYTPDPDSRPGDSPSGRISRYAWGRDYHQVIEDRLTKIEAFIAANCGADTKSRSYVDHGPVLEKAFAREAGLGFIGKNTLLITEPFGSWVFLSVILTTAELTAGEPQTSRCGSCRLCLDACPTGAIVAPFVLDARRCISYLTIENKGSIPEDLGAQMGDWVFGCDVCQEVCPFNARPKDTRRTEFRPGEGVGPRLDLREAAAMDSDDEFKRRFGGTPLARAKRNGLKRNAAVVLRRFQSGSADGETP